MAFNECLRLNRWGECYTIAMLVIRCVDLEIIGRAHKACELAFGKEFCVASKKWERGRGHWGMGVYWMC